MVNDHLRQPKVRFLGVAGRWCDIGPADASSSPVNAIHASNATLAQPGN